MNPTILAFMQATGGDIRKIVIEKLGPQISAALQKNVGEVEVYEQTRSIIGAVQRLYEVGSPVPATLILLFSVIVPFGKAGLVRLGDVHDQRGRAAPHREVRRGDRQMVDGRRLRRGAVHHLSGGAGQRDADRAARMPRRR